MLIEWSVITSHTLQSLLKVDLIFCTNFFKENSKMSCDSTGVGIHESYPRSCYGFFWAGTICEYDYAEMSIWCKISSTFAPYYEECEIPLCSDLPLCDSRLETFNGVLVDSTEGVALVSHVYCIFVHIHKFYHRTNHLIKCCEIYITGKTTTYFIFE